MITKMIAARLIMGAIKRGGRKRGARMAPTNARHASPLSLWGRVRKALRNRSSVNERDRNYWR